MKLESSYKLELEIVLKTVSDITIQNIIKELLTDDDKKQKEAFEELNKSEQFKGGEKEEYRNYLLGFCYRLGVGISKDFDKAKKFFLLVSENKFAQNELGFMFCEGEGGEKDLKAGFEWLHKAAKQGYSAAQNELGNAYWDGKGIVEDKKAAVEWYRRAVEQGYVAAQRSLGDAYWFGEGVEKDKSSAVEWYRRAAEQGCAGAQYNLGAAYWQGSGVAEDRKIAVGWFRRTAEQGCASAQHILGTAYWQGLGVAKDRKVAVEWFRRPAERGWASAQHMLGDAYWNGEGVEKDVKKACEWLYKAVLQKNEAARERLRKICNIDPEIVKNNNDILNWYLKLANQGDAEAQSICSRIFNISTLATCLESKDYKELFEQSKSAINRLNFCGRNIHAAQVRQIVGLLTPKIEILELSGNYIQDEGAVVLGRNLEKNKSLRGLMLGACCIGEKGAMALGKALEKNSTLQCLTLWGNNITAKGIHAIVQGIKKNPASGIQHLWLMGNDIDIETIEQLRILLQNNKKLRFVIIGKDITKPLVLGKCITKLDRMSYKYANKIFVVFDDSRNLFNNMTLNYIVLFEEMKYLKDSIIFPFLNLWTENSVVNLMKGIEKSLIDNDELFRSPFKLILENFLYSKFSFRDKEQSDKFYQQYSEFFGLMDNNWIDIELREELYKSLVNGIIDNTKPLATQDAIQFLLKLSPINSHHWGPIQYELGRRYEELQDIAELEKALQSYKTALEYQHEKAGERIKHIEEILRLKAELEKLFSETERLRRLERQTLIDMGKKRYAEDCRVLYHNSIDVIRKLEKLKAPDSYLEDIKKQIEEAVFNLVNSTRNIEDLSWITELCLGLINDSNCKDKKLKAFLSYNIAQCHERGINNLPPDDMESLVWYQKAMEFGYADAKSKAESLNIKLEASKRELERQKKIHACIQGYQKIIGLITTCERETVEKHSGSAIVFFECLYKSGKQCIEELRVLEYPPQELQRLEQNLIWVDGLMRLQLLFPEQAVALLEPWCNRYKTDKEWAKVHFRLGRLYEETGNSDKAGNNIQFARYWYDVALNHEYPGAQEALSSLAKRKSQNEKDMAQMLSQALTPLQETARKQQEAAQKQAEASEQQAKALSAQVEAVKQQTLAMHQQTKALAHHTDAVVDHTAAIVDQTAVLRAAFNQRQKELNELSKKTEAAVLQQQLAKQQELKENHEFVKDLEIFDHAQRKAIESLQREVKSLEDRFTQLERDKDLDADKCGEFKKLQEFLYQQYQTQQELLMKKEKLQKEQEELRQYPSSVYRVYKVIQIRLRAFLHGSLSLASGLVERSKNTKEDNAAKLIGLVGDLVPKIGTIAKVVSAVLEARAEQKMQSEAEKAAELMISHSNVDIMVEEIARKLAKKYETQIRCLTEKGAAKLSECAVQYMIHYIAQTDLKTLLDERNPLQQQLIRAVETENLSLKDYWGRKIRPETIKTKTKTAPDFWKHKWPFKDWTYEGVLQRSGASVVSDESSSKLVLYSFPKSKHAKYGFRLCTKGELPKDSEKINIPVSKV